jgi:undecaprenyl-diphosphatase
LAKKQTIVLVLGLASLAGLVVFALTYERDPLASLDADVAQRVAESMPAWGEWLARPFSWLGGWIGVTALTAAVIVALVRERAWPDLAFFLAVLVGSQLVVALLKSSFDRPRPDTGSAVPLPSSAAFPSGHATTGIAVFGAAAVLAAERLPSRQARKWLWTTVVVVGLTVGLSRIVLNVHYVTDVLAGWCLGLAWLAACLLARDAIRNRQRAPVAPLR